jgi:hypothetical protein
MPKFEAVSKKNPTIPFLMINAMALPESSLSSSSGSIFPCQYFPTFLSKSGDKVEETPTPERAAAEVSPNKDTPAAVAAQASFLFKEEPEENDPFDGMF